MEEIGPYLSERQWGTVREDHSPNGDAWNYFTHDQARSRAHRWGEDGLAGICDDRHLLCFALALWNGKDPIIKERLFGLSNSEDNHGEDVKEYYFYLDSTPAHSYMKYLYKYPQSAYPYADLVETNRKRTRSETKKTGFFDVLRTGDRAERLKVRSMVGLLPVCAATVLEPEVFEKYPELDLRFQRFLDERPELREECHDPMRVGAGGRRLFAVLDETNLRRVLNRVLDQNEFLSPYGLRSVSRYHESHPKTGWTGLVARAIHLFATSTPEEFLQLGIIASVADNERVDLVTSVNEVGPGWKCYPDFNHGWHGAC